MARGERVRWNLDRQTHKNNNLFNNAVTMLIAACMIGAGGGVALQRVKPPHWFIRDALCSPVCTARGRGYQGVIKASVR